MKTVIEMAKEAGLLTLGTADGSEAVYTWPKGITEEIDRFAELVRADEREACAKAYEDEADTWKAWAQAGAAKRKGATAIRARSNT